MTDPLQHEAAQRAVDAVANYFVGDSSMADALTKLCSAALDSVPVAALAGISMTVDARAGTYVFTHPDVVEVDQAQYDTGDGPCLDAFKTGEPVLIPSTLAETPYPRFSAAAARHGMLSVVSVPMRAGAHIVGALNLYTRVEGGFDAVALEATTAFATQGAYLLLNHQAYWDARSLSENLSQAMDSRAEIEQAKGHHHGLDGLLRRPGVRAAPAAVAVREPQAARHRARARSARAAPSLPLVTKASAPPDPARLGSPTD